ncbi:uncharacterized protein B0I36DRAFT_332050 [Microdochium trichocladiopsis]|uniref:Zn(2)-C6 fungal-type domain-containing protein n=1 Tax=Microdochium trichocladiopsis TaxID=1682393 RepID=A0A9P8XYA8_9PEZI|nr:uncharacterized protein B0I36DRAFT_332050 [Microdochium trichocladiopsis]KAH7024799.1 hypothetical protein B0I36DRAFT_332050 [Microdochium trichocladiopsis]
MAGGGASRQKSCNACVQGKRKCDKALPACGRCAGMGLVCLYGGRLPSARPSSSPPDGSMMTLDDHLAYDETTPVLPDTLDFAMAEVMPVDCTAEPGFSTTENGFEAFLESIIAPQPQFTAPSDQLEWVIQDSPSPTPILRKEDYPKFGSLCDAYQPWHLADSNTRVSFVVSVVKSFCPSFAQNSCTPFLHKELYQSFMPGCVLKAWTTCSQYTNGTATNRGMVLRVLHENVADLHETADSRNVMTSMERLGRLHALIFYQVIRMFDGDITLGSDAAGDMTVLEAWATDLLKLRDNLDGLARLPQDMRRERPPETWQRWVFAECVRRTCLMAFMIVTLWKLLTKQSPARGPMGIWAYEHRWTLSRHLWDAPGSFEFCKAWNEKPFFYISGFGFREFLECGRPDDVDSFARILLTVTLGIDEMKTFESEPEGQLGSNRQDLLTGN